MKIKFIALFAIAALTTVVIFLAGCSGDAGNQINLPPRTSGSSGQTASNETSVPKSTVAPTWITPEIVDTTITVPLDLVQTKINTHFEVALDKGKAYFMAYTFGGKTYVRADICPPCRSISYSLVKDTLVCDSCGTSFKALDGAGVRGACVNYPKASVPYETVDGKILMNKADLTLAYENTWSPGSP